MAFGVVMAVWTLALLPDLYRVFGEQGVAPQYPRVDYQWSALPAGWSGDTALLIGWIAAAAWRRSPWPWAGTVASRRRWCSSCCCRSCVADLYMFNAGDTILIVVAMVLALSCCGAALSLDQRRRAGSFWSAQTLAHVAHPPDAGAAVADLPRVGPGEAVRRQGLGRRFRGVLHRRAPTVDWAWVEVPQWLFGNAVRRQRGDVDHAAIELRSRSWSGTAVPVWVLAAGVACTCS